MKMAEMKETVASDGCSIFGRIPANVALRASMANRSAKWPSRPKSERIEPKCGPEFTPSFSFHEGEMIFTIGSCFARHIEIELKGHGYQVPAFDFGVPIDELWTGTMMRSGALNKYTPHSMLNELEFAFNEQDPDKYLIEHSDGMFLDLQLHIDKPVTYSRALERRLQIRELYKNCVENARVVIVTLGLIESWWDDVGKVYLNETPSSHLIRRHPERFFFEQMSPYSVIDCTMKIMRTLQEHGPLDQHVILTVSPIPFARTFTQSDAIVANSYSKAALRVAAECATQSFKNIDYYPSFESVTLSDRQLAWEDDQIHVTQDMVAFNVSRMLARYASPAAISLSL